MSFAKTIKVILYACLLSVILALSACVPSRLLAPDIENIQMSAHRGDAKSRVIIGELYEFGAGVPVDSLIAAQWYQLAAKQDDPEAQYFLGVMYETGAGLKRNTPEALRWLFRAGEQGHERAQILLAALYIKDKDLRQDFARRIKTYRQKAEKGDASAQYALGWINLEGAGLPVNFREGQKWLLKAAAQGNTRAHYTLGGIYLSGRETAANPHEALAWYLKSAASDIRSRVKLCQLYQGAGGLAENAAEAKQCRAAFDRSKDASLQTYVETQQAILNTNKEKHPVMALRACSKLRELDPDAAKMSDTCNALARLNTEKMKPRFDEARASLDSKDLNRFRNLLDPLLNPDFDETQLSRLIAGAWRLTEEENRTAEKSVQEQLRLLEAAGRTVTHRTANAGQINKLINAFREAVWQAMRDNPDDPALAALLRKGNRVIAVILQKMKAPSPPEDRTVSEPSEEPQEEVDPGEEDYAKARDLFNGGHFREAEALFEKTTKARGSRYIASAYIYLGIGQLARINPANVNDARKRHLKGLACFQNALRFDSAITLPAGYDKYQPEFSKAREQMH